MSNDTDLPDAWAEQDDALRYANPMVIGNYVVRTVTTRFPEPPGWKAITSRRGHDGGEVGPGAFVISVTSILDTEEEARTRAISWLPDDAVTPPVEESDIAPDPDVSDYVMQYRLLMQAVTLLNPGVHDLLSGVLTLEVTAPEWSAYTVTEVRRLRADCLAMATKLQHLAEEKAKQELASDIDSMPF